MTSHKHCLVQDQGVIDSGCSRHMIGNMSYLTDYEEINGGYVAFGGNPKGGKITGRGTIKSGNLDIKNVYFVKELKFNLFSASQMCDKKNSVFFNDTECIVLSSNFKLTDESHVLLKVPRKNNMYSVDLKNIVPKGDDYSRFSWVFFLATKDETSGILKSFITGVENLIDQRVKLRKNRTLIEAARTMLADSKLPTTFWAKAVNTACYVQNRVLVTKPHNKTPYELFLGRKPALGFIRPFRCPVTILNTIDHLGKFDSKADEGFFVGYSINSKAFRTNDPLFSQSSMSSQVDRSKPLSDDEKKVDENLRKDSESIDQEKDDNVNSTNNVNAASTNEVNVVGGKTSIELLDGPNMPALEDYSIFDLSSDDQDNGADGDMNNLDTIIQVSPIPTTRIHKDHPIEQIIGDLNSAPQTRRMTKNLKEHEEPKKVIHALKDPSWIEAMNKDFLVYHMDVKSAFLYGKIEEEVYVCQPPGLEDPDFPDRVYKVEKALYGLHQDPRAWYETLSTYLLDNGFQKTLFFIRDK
ncbi:putative ribonuclease H-like domain-containing protein, partial [Tanacetum coccineum]